MARRSKTSRSSGNVRSGVAHQRMVRALVVDGFEFETPLDAALHILWLLQRLSYYEKHREGQPCDGFRFREGIIASRKLLRKLKYKPSAMKHPNDKTQQPAPTKTDDTSPN